MAMFQIYALDEQTKSLPIMDTASGSVATFDTDMTENLVSVKCQIVAQQASGTPSPSNPLPITTYTEMNVSACGKNFFDKTNNTIVNNSRIATSTGGTYGASGYSVSPYIRVLDIQPYVLTSGISSYLATYDINKNFLWGGGWNTGASRSFGSNVAYVRFDFQTSDIDTVQLELGTATAYDPYNGTTKNTQFGQTVANGVLDITTGKLRVTHGYNVYDGTENWTLGGGINFYTATNADNTSTIYGSSLWCSHTQSYASASVSSGNNAYISSTHNLNFQIDSIPHTVADLKQWLADEYANGTPFQIVYPLATPIEIQLDSITLQALLNENNIWCDTGDTEVKFLLTVGKKIA